jgi:hypothetical protein
MPPWEKNFISELRHQDEAVVDEDRKSQLVFDHFNAILGDFEECAHGLDFGRLGLPTGEFSLIDSCFSENEVWSAISSMPPDKASGPDDFTAMFYRQHGKLLSVMSCKPSMPFGHWISTATT